jgi:hypothetical protein
MVLACFIGMGIMSASFEDGFSITTYYLGLGVTLVGASMKLFTKPGIVILIAGIAGNVFLNSYKPAGIAAAALAAWYALDYTLLKIYDK